MYNLIMTGHLGFWDTSDTGTLENDRFLTYTHVGLQEQFTPPTDEKIAKITSYPALFTYEFAAKAEAYSDPLPPSYIGRVLQVRRRQREMDTNSEFDRTLLPIPTEAVRHLAFDLDIDIKGLENYRSHWALKDVDLLNVFKRDGLIVNAKSTAAEVVAQLRTLHAVPPVQGNPRPKIFVVHGRDSGTKSEVAHWLVRCGLEDVILHNQSNLGRTLITKFQETAQGVAFAIVIMTPDDVGGLAGADPSPRARQNVIFELGFFIGALGPSKVAALIVGEVEKPSDYDGVAYISYDARGAWKLELAREFKALGIPFDPLG